jgi:ABC-type multidrug transport system ATPase subunit
VCPQYDALYPSLTLHSLLHFDITTAVFGVCPQYDALYPSLTAAEHLRLYARLKGVHSARVADEGR